MGRHPVVWQAIPCRNRDDPQLWSKECQVFDQPCHAQIVDALIDDATTAAFQDSQQDSLRGLPFLNPMRDLAGGPLRDRQNDPDLLLPNVSEKDY